MMKHFTSELQTLNTLWINNVSQLTCRIYLNINSHFKPQTLQDLFPHLRSECVSKADGRVNVRGISPCDWIVWSDALLQPGARTPVTHTGVTFQSMPLHGAQTQGLTALQRR